MKLRFEEKFRSLRPHLDRVVRSTRRGDNTFAVVEQGQAYAKLGIIKTGRGSHYFSRMDVIPSSDEDLSASVSSILDLDDYKDAGDCIVVLPQEFVSARFLRLPTGPDRDIDRMARLQARVHTPFPENDFVCGYYLSGRNDDGTCDLILYSARESVVKERISTIETCGERVIEVIPSSELVRRYICGNNSLAQLMTGHSAAVVNIDFSGACILLFDLSRLVRIRAVSSGLSESTAATTAGDRCRWQGLVADEIDKTVESYRAGNPGYNIERLVITGAKSLTTPLNETLKGSPVGIAVTTHDQCQDIAGDVSSYDHTGKICDDYSVCAFIGLTAREESKGLNMLPDESKRRIRRSLTRRYLWIALILVLANVALLATYFKIDTSRKEHYLAQLQAQIEETSMAASELRRLRHQIGLLGQQLGSDFGVLDVLNEYYTAAPSTIDIESFEYVHEDRSSVSGRADRLGDVLSYLDRLRKSPLLRDVKMDYATNSERPGTKQMQFRISARVGR